LAKVKGVEPGGTKTISENGELVTARNGLKLNQILTSKVYQLP